MKVGVITFPGSNCDDDCLYAVKIHGHEAVRLWHRNDDLQGVDAVIVPGGFSYGDYLRTGAIARFAPVMRSLQRFAEEGKPVIGICNGFQILLEAGLLPGVMLRNDSLKFICKEVTLKVESNRTPFTRRAVIGDLLRLPIAHAEGNYFVDEGTLAKLETNGQVVFRYVDENPNGSLRNIAGISNERGNVLGLMPHPERRVEQLLGGTDGRVIFTSLLGARP